MDGYDKTTYGDRIADIYDDWYTARLDPGPAVTFLADLAGRRPALELGVGTGRVAIPLAAAGVPVLGVDSSSAMLAKLRSKPGAEQIETKLADMADVEVEGRFGLIYAAFNSFFALESQAEQMRCFANVAAHLDDGGVFVIEAFVPDPSRYQQNQSLRVEYVSATSVLIEVARHEPVDQRIQSAHVFMAEGGTRIFPVSLRYAWPSELDAMAAAAGFACTARYNDFAKRPFTVDSIHHVSVYLRS